MLLKVTNFCSAGCSHCMEDSTRAGEHMTRETFDKALAFTKRAERMAWALGAPRTLLFSGGECTEHPDIVSLVSTAIGQGFLPVLITNGMWLENAELRAALLRPEWQLFVQVTHDARFYPSAPPPRIDDPRVTYIDAITLLLPLGRAGRREKLFQLGTPSRSAPSSFNLRSLTRNLKSFEGAVSMLRMRTAQGLSGHCIPSVTAEGLIMAGESRNCFSIGNVDSSNEELTEALVSMKCNNCGLVDNLSPMHKAAIGEA